MDEEARQNERVKKYQITIAQSMQLGTDIQQVLGNEKITDWVTREWLYICALDGMSAEQLTSMIENKRNLLQIKKERLDYLTSDTNGYPEKGIGSLESGSKTGV